MTAYNTTGTHTYTTGPTPTVGDCFTVARSPHTAHTTRTTRHTVGTGFSPNWRLEAKAYEQAAIEEDAAFYTYNAAYASIERHSRYVEYEVAMMRRQEAFNRYMLAMAHGNV